MGVTLQVEFSALSFSATSFSTVTNAASNDDVALLRGPPDIDASAEEIGMFVLLFGVLLIATFGCLWAVLGFCRWVVGGLTRHAGCGD